MKFVEALKTAPRRTWSYLRRDRTLNSTNHLISTACAIVGYVLLIYTPLPAWAVSMLYTLMWLHIILQLLGLVTLISILCVFDKIMEKEGTTAKMHSMAFDPNYVAVLLSIFVTVSLYVGGYTVAGAIYMIGTAVALLCLRQMRVEIDKLVLKRLSTI